MLDFVHVDVFSAIPYGGNALPVFMADEPLEAKQMLAITRELRQFEAVFLQRTPEHSSVRARVFDLLEELPFAGHPLLGAAAALHDQIRERDCHDWTLVLSERAIKVRTTRTEQGFEAVMDQGRPVFGGVVEHRAQVAAEFSLSEDDLHPDLPLQVVSTGLAYLVIPVQSAAMAAARIRKDVTPMLAACGAQFAVLLDESATEIRHWSNDGAMEDVATGSAAGAIGAYRIHHGLGQASREFTIQQGRFVGRPSKLRVIAHGTGSTPESISVGGPVCVLGRGSLERLP